MNPPKYDNQGGITDILESKVLNHPELDSGQHDNKRKGYNFLERLLLKYSQRVNYLLDENGKYKCRQERTPKVIRIGVTNRCAARCFYCPRSFIHEKGTGYMDFEVFERIVKWAHENNIKKISMALFGEPLLHPRILDMFDLVHKNGFKMSFSSNGIVLNKELADKLTDYPFDDIEFSMDGFSREEFLKGKQVDKYETAKKNVLYFLELARKKKMNTVFNVHFVDIGHIGFRNKIKFIKFWSNELKDLKHATSFSYEPHNWAGTMDFLNKKMGFFNRLLSKFELKKPCRYIKGLNINWNGDILVCGSDPTETAILGNINENSIEKIYNSEKRMKYLRENEQGTFDGVNCGVCTVNSVWPLVFLKKRIINKVVDILK